MLQIKIYCLFFVFLLFETCTHEKPAPQIINFNTQEKKITPPLIDFDTTEWTDIAIAEPSILLDLRYATTNNFVNEKMYPCGRCFLRPAVAKAIIKAQQKIVPKGLRLKLFDCYRPKKFQELLWKKVPNANYVTPPWKGSMHSRGVAVDLTIVDSQGKELDMGTAYDYLEREAHHTYTNLPPTTLSNRKFLKDLMKSVQLQSIKTEWWHYSYQNRQFPGSDMVWKCPEQE